MFDESLVSSIDLSCSYALTTEWRGEEFSLDAIYQTNSTQNSIKLTPSPSNPAQKYPSQVWRFLESPHNGYYYLQNKKIGSDKVIDVINDGVNREVWLAPKGNYSGQFWKITHVNEEWYRLTCQWLGEGKSLDIRNDGINTHVWLADTGDYSGQHWKLRKVSVIQKVNQISSNDSLYRLNTAWRGQDFSLDLDNINQDRLGLVLKPTDKNSSIQKWRFRSLQDGLFSIENLELGPGKVVEAISDNGLQMKYQENKKSQCWKIISIGSKWFKMISCSEGTAIDIRNDGINTKVWLANSGDYSGQHWKFNQASAAPEVEVIID